MNYELTIDVSDEENFGEPKAKRRKAREKYTGEPCSFCGTRTPKLRRHSFGHIGGCFDSEKSTSKRGPLAIGQVVTFLLSVAVALDVTSPHAAMMAVARQQLVNDMTPKVKQSEVAFFDEISVALRIPAVEYSLSPINSPVLLAHWAVVLKLCETYPKIREIVLSKSFMVVPSVQSSLFLFDSSFSLYDSYEKNGSRSTFRFDDICGPSSFPLKFAVNCFDSLVHPDVKSLEGISAIDRRILSIVGVGPQSAKELEDCVVSRLSDCLSCRAVVGIGVIGLNFTVPGFNDRFRGCQVRAVERTLFYIRDSQLKKPLVICCFDTDGEITAFNLLYTLCVSFLDPFYPICFSCFSYSSEQYSKWSRYFHNTVFAFSPSIFKNLSRALSVIKLVPIHSILVQSSSLSSSAGSTNSSVVCVLDEIARCRSIEYKEFVSLVYRNSLRFYQISSQ